MFSASILAIVLGYTWIVAPVAPKWTVGAVTLLVVGLAVAHALKTGEWGLKAPSFLPALAWSAAFTVFAVLVLYVAGAGLHTWHDTPNVWGTLVVLVPWGLGQQFALQTVFLREAQGATSKRGGVWLAALMFASLHLPNPLLAVVTGVAAVAWCWIYDRDPNVLPLALSHALLTLAVLSAFDDRLTGHLKVGVAYLSLR